MSRGGKRFGSGRKPRANVLAMPGTHTASAPAEPVAIPAGLTVAQRKVWTQLAPIATARGLLTPDTAAGFALLCQSVDRLEEVRKRIDHDGWTFIAASGERKRHPLWPSWHALQLRVEQQLARFGLIADGKAAAAPAAPVANPWAAIAPGR